MYRDEVLWLKVLMFSLSFQICEKFKADSTWTVVRDVCYQAPYAYKNNLWIGYDDEQSLRNKVQYLQQLNFAMKF